MSRSRRRAIEGALEAIWRLEGDAAARLFVDDQRTGFRCPACAGTRRRSTLTSARGFIEGETNAVCPTCQGEGALRPRSGMDPRARPDGVEEIDAVYRLGGYAATKRFAIEVAREHCLDLDALNELAPGKRPIKGLALDPIKYLESSASLSLRTGYHQGRGPV